MKKLINLLLVLALSVCAISAFTACSGTNSSSEVISGAVYSVETDDDGNDYAVLTKFRLNDEDAEKVSNNELDKIADELKNVVINEYKTKDSSGKEVTYPVKEISADAFSGQKVIKTLTFGNNVETIGAGCLAGCVNLEKLTVCFTGASENAVNDKKTMGYLFGTEEVTGASSATVYYNSGSSGSATYYIPDSLKEIVVTGDKISDFAFSGLTVETITLQGAVKTIGEKAFYGMTNLASYTIPATVEEIGNSAFENCTSLTKVDFSKATALKTIGKSAFAGCSLLGYTNLAADDAGVVTLPSSVTSLGEGAFKGCTSLTRISISGAIVEIGSNTFYNCTKLETVNLVFDVKLGITAFGKCENLKSVNVGGTNKLSDYVTAYSSAFDGDFVVD